MCRFVLYMGPPVTMSSLVTEPEHSIIHQSYKAQEREEPLNGDGFGVAWYAPRLSDEAVIFKDVSPAWNNRNLLSIAPVIESECLMAHVRAATPGLPVAQMNCHPFGWRRLALMHNGEIAAFSKIRRALRHSLSDEAYEWVQGSTDSEHLFALIIDQIRKSESTAGPERLYEAVATAIQIVEEMTSSYRGDLPSRLNLVLTDGSSAVVTRYSSDRNPPETLYLQTNRQLRCDRDGASYLDATGEAAVLLASEPLTRDPGWDCVEPNRAVLIDGSRQIETRPLALR